MTMGILFWISAGVVCFAMMQTIFKLLLKNSKGKNYIRFISSEDT